MSDRSKARALRGGKVWQRFNKRPAAPKSGRQGKKHWGRLKPPHSRNHPANDRQPSAESNYQHCCHTVSLLSNETKERSVSCQSIPLPCSPVSARRPRRRFQRKTPGEERQRHPALAVEAVTTLPTQPASPGQILRPTHKRRQPAEQRQRNTATRHRPRHLLASRRPLPVRSPCRKRTTR